MKYLLHICFLFPLISSVLNIQGFFIIFLTDTLGVYLAYFNLALIALGIIIMLNKIGTTSSTAKMWFFFYMSYFCFGLTAMILFSNYTPIVRTLIPLVYFTGFYMYLSVENHRKIFFKIATYGYFIASLLLILFVQLNFDMDYGGISLYKVDRPGGVYGDANNAALASIISFILLKKFFKAETLLKKYIKTGMLLTIALSLFLTFSTTGVTVFIIVLFINNLNYFKKEKLVLLFTAVIVVFIGILNLKSLTSDMNLTEGQRMKINNLVNVITLNTEKVDNSGRGDLLKNLFRFIYENPIVGNGIDFSVNIRGHNTYFGVWADAGIVTFIVFLVVLFIYLKNTLKTDNEIKFFCLSLLISLLIFMISLQTIINQPYILVLFPYIGYLIDENLNKQNIT